MKISSRISTAAAFVLLTSTAHADPFFFSTGSPDGLMATGSRPDIPPGAEIESADDFILNGETKITGGTFTGLLPSGAPLSSVTGVVVEIYRVFPLDSTVPPDGRVPSRTNSPSDNALDSRDSAASTLSFTTAVLSASFTAANSVLNGINALPNPVKTGGEGSVTGEEVLFNVTFATPFDLPADHYFFVPQVQLSSGNFFWLSAAKPIVGGTGPFLPDLQEWIRNANLDPDWLRVGTDIVGIVGGNPAPTFNAAFSLDGVLVPEPSSLALFGTALLGFGLIGLLGRRRRGTG